MAKFLWSTVTNGVTTKTITGFDPSADIFVFDHDSSAAANEISAMEVTISTVGNSPTGDVTFSYNDNGTTKTVTITGLSLSELTTTTSDAFGNVRFNDQSVLIVGDNISNTPGATTLDNAANTLTGGPGNDQLVGLGGNDSLVGKGGDDLLIGNGFGTTGTDTLVGGAGNDTYVVDNSADVITESSGTANGTADLVQSSVSFTLAANVEQLTLLDTSYGVSVGAINGTGNTAGNNILTGNSSANTLSDNNGTAKDTLVGGLGNDTYIIGNTSDVITESSGTSGGIDLIQTAKTYSISSLADIEQLTLTGSANIDGTGNAADNTLIGNSGNNNLDGGTGADSMIGGAGNDIYTVDNEGDIVTEASSAGTDLVKSSVDFTLTTNVEQLTLLDAGGTINGTGNTAANTITGNSSANTLDDGGSNSADSLVGKDGNDTYVVHNASAVITENASEGTDLVQSSVTFTLAANVEQLTLIDGNAINGTGNTAANTITGNSSANTLSDGGSNSADSMAGLGGNDTYLVNNSGDTISDSAGTDLVQSTVTFTLTATSGVEKLTLLDAGGAINGTGNTAANTITGNSSANTLSDGGSNSADSMAGLGGNDTYLVNNSGDTISDSAGTDLVQSTVTFTLTATSGVEKLTLLDGGAINGTGNTAANTITGNSSANTLDDGGSNSADSLVGKDGNDTYVVHNASAVITENASEGTDLVQSSVTFTLAANVENLQLTGTTAINGFGNAAGGNSIAGNAAANILNDNGAVAKDTLAGGAGNDTYVVSNSSDVITENSGTAEGTADLVQSSVSYTLSSNVEQLTLTGTSAINGTGSGDATNNLITGNSLANTLNDGGGSGNDTLNGGAGNDTLVATSTGVDTLNGGEGSDTYRVSVDNSTATTINISDSGVTTSDVDTVEATLANGKTFTLVSMTAIELLTLMGSANSSGTGNLIANTITGNDGANTLLGMEGDDTLKDDSTGSSTGADSMNGGVGNDTYYVTNSNDKVSEAANDIGDQSTAGSGTDIVFASVSFTLDDAGTIEKLTLTANSITGTGNFQDNTIVGSTGSNTLLGGAGNDILDDGITASGSADSMNGQDGNDTYFVHHTGDTVVDSSGTDTVQSTVTFTLANSIENLTLLDVGGAINGTGSTVANKIIGNSSVNTLSGGSDTASDTLQGGGGNDIITVGGGKDTVVFEANAVANGLGDSVSGFTVGSGSSADKLDFNNFFGAATNITVLPAVAEGSSGAVAIATGNVLQVIDTGGNLDATGIAALFGTGKPFEAALASEKFVMITADTSGDAKGWYIDVGANAIVDASDVSQVVTLVGVNNLATTPLVSANIVA